MCNVFFKSLLKIFFFITVKKYLNAELDKTVSLMTSNEFEKKEQYQWKKNIIKKYRIYFLKIVAIFKINSIDSSLFVLYVGLLGFVVVV